MKKLSTLVIVFAVTVLSIVFCQDSLTVAENTSYRVISNKANTYISLDFDNEEIFNISGDTSNLAFVVLHNDIIICDPVKLSKTITVNGQNQTFGFYKIDTSKYDEKYNTSYSEDFAYSYVLDYNVMPNENSSLKTYLDTNASVKSDGDCDLYKYDYTTKDYTKYSTLPAGQKIKLINGYDKNTEFTKIQYQTEDLFIETCYIKTSSIHVSQISIGTICAIMFSIACVSIILIVLGIKNKHKKKRKKTQLI